MAPRGIIDHTFLSYYSRDMYSLINIFLESSVLSLESDSLQFFARIPRTQSLNSTVIKLLIDG